MRGSPPTHLIVLLLAFAIIALPLARLTSGSGGELAGATAQATVSEGEPSQRTARVLLRYAHRPKVLSLVCEERDLLQGVDWAEVPVEFDAELPVGPDGLELTLEAAWDSGSEGSTAVTVEVEPEGEERRSQTRWSDDGSISDVLTFEWN